MKRIKTVDEIIAAQERWEAELRELRGILQSLDLTEEVKWGMPCYTAHGKNVVGIGAFKAHFGLWFFQGALLKDEEGVLINAQEGRTKAMRQWRMTGTKDIRKTPIRSYVKEAIALAKSGKEIAPARGKPVVLPPEFQKALKTNTAARKAFEALRPGLQREYADHVAEAKREDTKARRIEKILPMIAAGKGLNDKYR